MADTHPTQADENWWRGAVDLPGLPAQLRRRQRRRDRRPRRRPRPAALPGRTGRRRALVQPLVPLADGRRRLRRRRLPRHRPGLRHAGRGREADRRGARAWASASSSTSCPTTSPTAHPWFREALAAGPGSPARDRFWFRPGRGEDGETAAQQLALAVRRPGLDPDHRTTTARRGSGTCTSSLPSSPTSTGSTPTVRAGARGRAAVLVRPRRRRRAHRLRRPGHQGPGAARPADRPQAPPCRTPTSTATSCTRSTAPGARIADSYPGTRVADRRGVAAGRRAVRPLPAARRDAHRLQLRLPGLPLGAGPAARRPSTPRSPRTRRSAPPPPGCCPTTT